MTLTPADLGTHPPKPRLALRVGVTGHRDLSQAPVDTLRGEIEQVLRLAASAMSGLPTSLVRSCYTNDQPLLLVISPLARGADCLVAETALASAERLGVEVRIQAPLPFCRADYEKDADEAGQSYPEWLEQHRRLRDLPSTTVLELDGSHASKESRDRAYEAVGHLVVDACDVLIAIWDGLEAKGQGGTGAVVGYAKSQGRVVAHIAADGSGTTLLVEGSAEALPKLDEMLQDTLLPASIPHTLAPVAKAEKLTPEIGGALEYFHATEARFTLGVFYAMVNHLLSRGWPSWPKFFPKAYVEKSNEDWAQPPAMELDDHARGYYQRFDAWADNLAIYYADWMRSSFTWNYLAGAVSLILGLVHLWHGQMPEAEHHEEGSGKGLVIAEIVLGVSVLAVFAIARMREVRERWVDYRRLSERLRWTALLSALGAGWRHGSQPDTEVAERLGHSAWVDWYLIAIMRQTGLPGIRLTTGYLEHYRRLLMERLKGQLDHHESRIQMASRASGCIRAAALGAFGLGLIASMLRALPIMPEHVGSTLLGLTAAFTVLSASAAGFAGTADYSKLIQSSRALIPAIRELLAKLDRAAPTRAALMPIAQEVSQVMMQEQDDWVRVFSLKEIEVG